MIFSRFIYASTPHLRVYPHRRVYPISTRLPHIDASTPYLLVYPVSMRLSHIMSPPRIYLPYFEISSAYSRTHEQE